MKNIFVATDFSDASVNAGKYAVELARHFKSRVFLFNAYLAPVEIPESYLFYTREQVGEAVLESLEKEAKIINKYGIVEIEKCIAEGHSANVILAEATSRKADLLICGMKNAGKTLKRLFGSTATALARQTNIPLIIVPEAVVFHLPINIAYASDMQTIPTSATTQALKEIGDKFNSKLSVVSVVDGKWDESCKFREHYSEFIDEFRSMQPSLESLAGADVALSLEKYIENNFINLVTVVPHKHSFLSRIFSKSVTKQMAFLTKVPLLILPGTTEDEANHDISLAGKA